MLDHFPFKRAVLFDNINPLCLPCLALMEIFVQCVSHYFFHFHLMLERQRAQALLFALLVYKF